MIVLVANLGSTSFKYKLFDVSGGASNEQVLAVGAADRIGGDQSSWSVEATASWAKAKDAGTATFRDHRAAIDHHLDRLVALKVIASIDRIDAIGFKAVHGGPISG